MIRVGEAANISPVLASYRTTAGSSEPGGNVKSSNILGSILNGPDVCGTGGEGMTGREERVVTGAGNGDGARLRGSEGVGIDELGAPIPLG